jgi:hypothetical protein
LPVKAKSQRKFSDFKNEAISFARLISSSTISTFMSVKLILKIYNPLPSNGKPENRLICSGPGK